MDRELQILLEVQNYAKLRSLTGHQGAVTSLVYWNSKVNKQMAWCFFSSTVSEKGMKQKKEMDGGDEKGKKGIERRSRSRSRKRVFTFFFFFFVFFSNR